MEFSGQDKPQKAVSLKAVNSKLDSLRALGNLLEGRNHLKFDGRFGNILTLLEVDVQPDVITALVQFYDPYLRCFIFKDFQLATTTEELTGFLGFY
jgi:hypothetical protein